MKAKRSRWNPQMSLDLNQDLIRIPLNKYRYIFTYYWSLLKYSCLGISNLISEPAMFTSRGHVWKPNISKFRYQIWYEQKSLNMDHALLWPITTFYLHGPNYKSLFCNTTVHELVTFLIFTYLYIDPNSLHQNASLEPFILFFGLKDRFYVLFFLS